MGPTHCHIGLPSIPTVSAKVTCLICPCRFSSRATADLSHRHPLCCAPEWNTFKTISVEDFLARCQASLLWRLFNHLAGRDTVNSTPALHFVASCTKRHGLSTASGRWHHSAWWLCLCLSDHTAGASSVQEAPKAQDKPCREGWGRRRRGGRAGGRGGRGGRGGPTQGCKEATAFKWQSGGGVPRRPNAFSLPSHQ